MNRLAEILCIDFPLIQAGMGGVAGPALAAAVASAGAGGVVGLYRMTPTMIEAAGRETQRRTSRIFGVNLIPELVGPSRLAEQVDAVLHTADRRVFFTFYGMPESQSTKMLRAAGHPFIVMVGSAAEISLAEELGAAAVALQGVEAGGHLLSANPVAALVREAIDCGCRVPLLASGGIGSGHDFRRLRELGAIGCICGTLFVATEESRAHGRYKDAIIRARARDTVVTDVYDIGWPARPHRVLRNALTDLAPAKRQTQFIATLDVEGTRHPIARYSAMVPTEGTTGHIDEMVMYCGLSVEAVHDIVPARTCVERFIEECRSGA